MRKEAMSLCKRFRKTISDTVIEITKASKAAAAEAGAVESQAAAVQEAAIVAAGQPSSTPTTAPTRGDVQLALFGANDVDIPAPAAFSVDEPWQFNPHWLAQKMGDGAATDLPFCMNANIWLQHAMMESAGLANNFGRFLADFVGSAEYHSPLGRASSSLAGCGSIARQLRAVILSQPPPVKFPKDFLERELTDVKQRGHLNALFSEDSMTALGIAPNKCQVAFEQLGFGVLKMQASGFSSIILLHADACRKAHDTPLTLKVIPDSISGLQPNQVKPFIEALGHNKSFKITLGAGCCVCVPPGWFIADQTALGNALGFRCPYSTSDIEVLKSANALCAKPASVLKCPCAVGL